MANAINKRGDLTIGFARLGLTPSGDRATVDTAVHDGDTVSTDAEGNFPVRFLGVDAPERSFTLPKGGKFVSIHDPAWEEFLSDPFSEDLPPFDPALDPSLEAALRERTGSGCAANHARHCDAATLGLKTMVSQDMTDSGLDVGSFRFFLAFANEVLDRYGRFLAFLNQDRPSAQRKPSYNERLITSGLVSPYAIWPNLNPFATGPSLIKAVPQPGQPPLELDRMRQLVRDARDAQLGIYEAQEPLRLEAFELRFLSRTTAVNGRTIRTGPDRWVIDVGAQDDRLLSPHAYHRIARSEDRLFVSAEYVPLFESQGWKKGDG